MNAGETEVTFTIAVLVGCIAPVGSTVNLVLSYCVPFMRTYCTVTALPPGHATLIFTVSVPLAQPYGLPTFSCSPLPMNENDRAPIHAATAMLTATVTAMRMIEATTGLRAFLLLSIFILVLIPPFWGC